MSRKSNHQMIYRSCASAIAGACAFLAHPAFAQVQEIVVTAEKRTESVQDVGIAITALSGDDLQAANVNTPRDLFQRIPNVSVQSNGTAGQLQLGIRGISFATFSPIGVQPVLVFQDEVVLNSPQVGGLFLLDPERVEVLRGPQNTLYGRNTTAGAVNFISRKPEIGGPLGGFAELTLGNDSQINGETAVNVPVSDNAAMRFAFQALTNNGFWKNLNIPGDKMGERDQFVGRVQLLVETSSELSLLFNAHGAVSHGGQRPYKFHGLFSPDTPEDERDPGVPTCTDIDFDNLNTNCVTLFGQAANGATDETYSELRNDRDDIDAYGGFVNATWHGDSFDFTSITAYETNSYDHWEENDGLEDIPFVLFRQKSNTDQISQEFRLTSTGSGPLQWILGAFGFWEQAKFRVAVPIFASFASNSRVRQDNDLYSVYGQVDYDLTDALKLSVGGRYVHEKKKGRGEAQFSVGLDVLDPEDPDQWLYENLVQYRDTDAYALLDFKKSWDLWGGKVGLEYRPSDDVMVYGSISRGAKAGQFTDSPDAILTGVAATPAAPETVWTYETGIRAEWADRKVLTNLTIFYNDYTNQQLQVTFPNDNGDLSSTVVNAAKSRTYGAEFDLQVAPGDGWKAALAVGYLDTKVTKDSLADLTDGFLAIETGRDLTNAPNWTLNGSLEKEWVVDETNSFRVSVDGRYVTSRTFDMLDTSATRPYVTDPAYFLVNAFAEYRFGPSSNMRFSVWAKNLTDELYFLGMQQFGIGSSILQNGEPRTFGATFGIEF